MVHRLPVWWGVILFVAVLWGAWGRTGSFGLEADEPGVEYTPIPTANGSESNGPESNGSESPDATGGGFRIDSTLRIEKGEEITEIKTSTIFSEAMVFDFIGDNGEVIIYDRGKRLFTLLDPIHRIQTELSGDDIDRFLLNIRERIREKKDKFCLFMIEPVFELSKNDEAGDLLFQSKWVDYRIKTRSFDEASLADDYFSFSNASCGLNVYQNPGTLTPLARMKVNEILQKEERFPALIRLTVYPKGKWLFARIIEIESEHKIVRRLSEDDRGKIIRALHFAKQFPKMTFGKYYKTVTGNDHRE